MTSEPFAFNQGTAADVFAQQAASVYRRERAIGNTYRVVGRTEQAIFWEVVLRDFSHGIGPMRMDWEPGGLNNTYTTAEGLAPHIPGYLIATFEPTSDANPAPTGDLQGVHFANIFDTLIVGAGSGTDVSLGKETSATDPTLVAITYNPTGTSSICSLSTAVFNSADRRLIVGLNEDPAQIVGDASGTVDATMHADTERLWGLVQTWLPDGSGFRVLLYSGGASGLAAIRSLSTADATGTQPTVQTSGIPNGGFAVADHELQLSGSFPRVFFVIPKEDLSTNSMLKFGAEKLGYVVSFDLYGKDQQTLAFNDMPNGVKIACAVHGYDGQLGIAASDGDQLVWHDGVREYNLGWRMNRAEQITNATDADINSEYAFTIRGLMPRGNRLYYHVRYGDVDSTAQLYSWWEYYDFDTDSFHPANLFLSHGSEATTSTMVLCAGPMPFSAQTNNVHVLWSLDGPSTAWYGLFIPFPHENPYWIYRRSSSGGATTGKAFEDNSSLRLVSPQWKLPDATGRVSVVDEIAFEGEFPDASGGSTSDVTISIGRNDGRVLTFTGGAAVTFPYANRLEQNIRRPNKPSATFSRLWVHIDYDPGNFSRSTATLLPIVLRGRTLL